MTARDGEDNASHTFSSDRPNSVDLKHSTSGRCAPWK